MTILKIGHRGACGHAPENTLLSMAKAIEFSVDAFEFDVQMSRDGQPVVIHDATLERTTNGKGRVEDYTLAELQRLDAGKGEKIPSLKEVFEFVNKRCGLIIELKSDDCADAVANMICDYAKRGWEYEQMMVCSFNHFQLGEVRAINPNIQCAALMAGIPVSLAECAVAAGAVAFNPCIHHISKALVKDAHARGLKVFTWTANTPHDIEKARALEVDGIVSDFPDRL